MLQFHKLHETSLCLFPSRYFLNVSASVMYKAHNLLSSLCTFWHSGDLVLIPSLLLCKWKSHIVLDTECLVFLPHHFHCFSFPSSSAACFCVLRLVGQLFQGVIQDVNFTETKHQWKYFMVKSKSWASGFPMEESCEWELFSREVIENEFNNWTAFTESDPQGIPPAE